MMLGMGLFWVAVIVGLVWLVRDRTDLRQRPPEETALTILDRRIAEGDVSLDDYHHARPGHHLRRKAKGVSDEEARNRGSSGRRRSTRHSPLPQHDA